MGFNMFGISFVLMQILVTGVFIAVFVKIIRQWGKNNASPRLTVPATVVSKRQNVSHHHRGHDHMTHTSTNYYVTFQVDSGDRIELAMSGYEYGMLVEGDRGNLRFQGTRYQGFERT